MTIGTDNQRHLFKSSPGQSSERCICGEDVTMWVDTNSIATGMVVESNGSMTKDASWLQAVHENKNINLAELEAVLRGVILALWWKAKNHTFTNRLVVYIGELLTPCPDR